MSEDLGMTSPTSAPPVGQSERVCETFADWPGERATANFPNGYSASVIRSPHSYGGEDGLYELAVLSGGHLDYSTSITSDVEGHLSPEDVTALLSRIAALPLREA